jgi:AraC family transcriptional regulator, transcriptional activator of pobA
MRGVQQVTFRNGDGTTTGVEVIPWRALREKGVDHHLALPSLPDFHVVMHMTEGSATHHLDFLPYRIRQGDTVFMCKGQVHQFDLRARFDAVLLLFTEEFLLLHSPGSTALADNRLFNYHLYPPVLKRSMAQQEELALLFASLLAEYQRQGPHNTDVLHHWVELLLLKAERAKPADHVVRISGRDYAEFMRFKNFVEAGFAKTRRAEDYADLMTCSLKTLNALCERATGRSVKTFVDERTLLEIRRHLSVRDKSVKELAFLLGFQDASNLVKYVKRLTGKVPSELVLARPSRVR